jgi:hypothetical protein
VAAADAVVTEAERFHVLQFVTVPPVEDHTAGMRLDKFGGVPVAVLAGTAFVARITAENIPF